MSQIWDSGYRRWLIGCSCFSNEGEVKLWHIRKILLPRLTLELTRSETANRPHVLVQEDRDENTAVHAG